MSSQGSPLVHRPFLPGLSSAKAAARPGRAFPHPQLSGECRPDRAQRFPWAGRGRREAGAELGFVAEELLTHQDVGSVHTTINKGIKNRDRRGCSNCSPWFAGGFVCPGVKRAKFVLLPHLLLLPSKYRIPDLGSSSWLFLTCSTSYRSCCCGLSPPCFCCSQNKSGVQRYCSKQ